jgi:hypothetical protein
MFSPSKGSVAAAQEAPKASLLGEKSVEVQSASTRNCMNQIGITIYKTSLVIAAVVIALAITAVLAGLNTLAVAFCPPALAGTIPATLAIAALIGTKGKEIFWHHFTECDDDKQTQAPKAVVETEVQPNQKKLVAELANSLYQIVKSCDLNEVNSPAKQEEARAIFNSIKAQGLSEEIENKIYHQVWVRAGKPDELEFGKNHAFDMPGSFYNSVQDVIREL